MIIDAHAHIYPDKIAAKASANVGAFYDLPMHMDGTLNTLLLNGRRHGIQRHLVHSVATLPSQVRSINDFLASTAAAYPDELIGFATLHPDMDEPELEVERVIGLGLVGIKLHPDFQQFAIDDRKMDRIYAAIAGKLPLLIHTGDKRYRYSNPHRVLPVLDRFPQLDLICAHFGGWSEWEEAAEVLAHRRLWVDTCSSYDFLGPEKIKKLIYRFGVERVLFGSDYPMWDPGEELANIRGLGLPSEDLDRILGKNLLELLRIGGQFNA